jgi:hypothetical protein
MTRIPKFHIGDLVHIVKDLGSSMSHFTGDIDAIVIRWSDGRYGVFLKDHGPCWWYWEEQLTLLKRDQGELLKQWEIAHEERA